MLERAGVQVVFAVALQAFGRLDPGRVDVLLVDLDEVEESPFASLFDLLEGWKLPVLFNDASVQQLDGREARRLASKLLSLTVAGAA